METSKWSLSNEEKQKYIDALTEDLAPLRAKARISQEELANMVGISRQTYSGMELNHKKMSWSTYMALIMFYDSNISTRAMLRNLNGYPKDLISRMNDGRHPDEELLNQANGELNVILSELDDQARHAVKTMLLVEYARCKNVTGEYVIRAFEGLNMDGIHPDTAVEEALRSIKNRKK